MSKECYKNMEVSAYGTSQYATSVTVSETATLESIPVMGGASTPQVMTNEPKGTIQFSAIMTNAAQVESLTGRLGKVSKPNGTGPSSPQVLKAGALEAPTDSSMTSMSVSAEAGGTVTISSTSAYNGQSDYGGTPSTPSSETITPLLAASISGTLTPGGGGSVIVLSGMQSFTWSASQSFKEDKKVGSDVSTTTLSEGTITLELASDTSAIDYDIVRITGASGLCGENGADDRNFWTYNINLFDCSGSLLYLINHSGILEGRGTSAAPGSATKTTLTFVDKFPNAAFPDETADCG